MTKPHHDHTRSDAHEASGNDKGRRIEGAADEIFARANDAILDVADRATHLAQDTLERGRAGIREADRSSRAGHPNGSGRRGTSPLATALAVGAMGYAIATLIRGAVRKRDSVPGSALPDKVSPAAPAE
ncbi:MULTISPECIES: hypothetical protein [Methylobacterium]|uniref:DUF3618 domain-containing protein n=1 Tax=Methylobacterium bullatum TaxID=570505 RepID=A0AAV4Z294_9HYPH|nr:MULTISPECIES: hypothetical protein [Methylobacterium]MBD8901010.1 hypothetical protein [Methylobacterium bullatum]TXN24545.1 hypothetical protein FV220_20095 [Methylobacterium sp. WL19]GJD38058.1 hypothetical protein OICFNHDK_0498 [Methylobacterium bullatum]